jgi:hypothetical protein
MVHLNGNRSKPRSPLLVVYFAGHGIGEGVAWNHFAVPGNFVYRGAPERLDLEGLSRLTLHSASLVDTLEKLKVPFILILDTCYEGKEGRFDSPVLAGPAIESLRSVAGILRYMNEFHGPNPVLFSEEPGKTVDTAPDPFDTDADSVAPLARRAMIVFKKFQTERVDLTLGEFLMRMTASGTDPRTAPAITHAQAGPTWKLLLSHTAAALGRIEMRRGSSTTATVCCSPAAVSGGPNLKRDDESKVSMRGTIELDGAPGEIAAGGRKRTFSEEDGPITLTLDGPGVATLSFGPAAASWEITFSAPRGRRLEARRYKQAARYPFQSTNRPGLAVTSSDLACNEVSGEFSVVDLAYDAGGRIERLAMRITQFCDRSSTPVRAAVTVRASAL